MPMNDRATNEQGEGISAVTADLARIMELIPHRYPMLLVDKVVDMIADQSATGIKNVTINEPFFEGHFPGHPVMPGVLIVEAMAQTAAVLAAHTIGEQAEGKLVYFMSIDNARFRKPVTPGDTLRLFVNKERSRRSVWKFSAEAKVDDKLVCEATFTAMIVDG